MTTPGMSGRGIPIAPTTVAHEINDSFQLLSHQQRFPHCVQHSPVTDEPFMVRNSQGTRLFYVNENDKGNDEEESNSYDPDPEEQYDEDGKQSAPWRRVKWTSNMVELLIDLVHSIGENRGVDNSISDKKKSSSCQRKGKWRLVSTMMNNKGCYVSPQQCEDKFNDLNKRYKRLNEILGKDIVLDVISSPNMLDNLRNISTKAKEEAKKMLTSKHTFYKELHAFYSGSRKSTNTFECNVDENMNTNTRKCALVENDGKGGEENEYQENHSEKHDQTLHNSMASNFLSRLSTLTGKEQRILLAHKMLELEEHKVRFEAQALEVRKQQFEWQKQIAEKDADLNKMREDNKRMRFENAQLLFRLKQRELELDHRRRSVSSN